ncbi:MAG TPA: hypothetical protein VM802_10865 [Chitinophaga sp.]|uniref:EndoS/ChiA family endoglycosidase n=1 Tax=Chitinophaga sp. TaxID=1869181 RepID=UPI002C2037D0|nr:hypothetical protein [Chitinophaga sp.]HVI45366.1 hypothetical protein [Chitinophaga sp.]
MKTRFLLLATLALFSCKKQDQIMSPQSSPNPAKTELSVGPPYKVAYYAFDNGGPRLIDFAREATVVVLFEAHEWRFVDSTKYKGDDLIFANQYYKSYGAVMYDVKILQNRGVKVLMNVDDNAGWSTNKPFTKYDNSVLNNTQFISQTKRYVLDSLKLDGIALDIEHGATNNASYRSLLKGLGSYFGPLSNNPSKLYIAAIYSGAPEGGAIGKDTSVAKYVNFVEDMGYWGNYVSRFTQWSDYIGVSKVMVGVSAESNFKNLANDTAAAKWQPASGKKAGIMVYAANLDSGYTNTVFRALSK